MALTRKFLSALSIEADKVDEIIAAHTETVDALKEQRDSYKADAEKLTAVQKELDDLKAATPDNGSWEEKYNQLKTEYDNYKQEQATKETAAQKREAYKSLLKEAGISEKRIDTVLKVTDLNSVELDKDGKIKGAKDYSDKIKAEWADFITTEQEQGANTATPPTSTGGKTITKAQIMAIKDGTERRKAIAENPELFGLKFD